MKKYCSLQERRRKGPFIRPGTFGKLFSKKATKDINYTFGYRTKRSMMNMETWMFAHAYIGKLWFICGFLLFPLSAVVMTFVFGKGPDTVGIAGGILTIVQMIIVIGTRFFRPKTR